jgi:hypothetical protein
VDIIEVEVLMDVVRHELLESLANTLADYRQGEISPITPNHVEKWLNQFDPGDQMWPASTLKQARET